MRNFTAACLAVLLLTVAMPGGVRGEGQGSDQVFTGEQIQAVTGDVDSYLRQLVRLDGVFYGLTNDAAVLRWDGKQAAPELFCQLTDTPQTSAAAYEDVPLDQRAVWEDTVSFLAPGEGTLWGVNVFSGKFGTLSAQGIEWSGTELDMSPMRPQGSRWPLRLVDAFVRGNSLYVYAAHDDGDYPHNRYDLFAFDLTTGTSATLDIKNAQGLCPFQGDDLLLLHYQEGSWVFRTFGLTSQELSDEPYASFEAPYDSPVGGLAYDAQGDRLYMAAEGQIWRSDAGGAFSPVAVVLVSDMVGEMPGFLLEDGRYGLLANVLYLRQTEAPAGSIRTLVLMGAIDGAIMESFSQENPQVAIRPEYEMLSPEEIARRLVVRDGTADVYAAMVSYPFYSIVNKGYAASLAGSSILSADIADMYPNFRQALQDRQGNPIAYPHTLQLGNWSVNITLWRAVYGDQPLPATMDQFLDAMKAWEETHAAQYPDFSFAGTFDYVQWIRQVVNTYIQQQVQVGQPMALRGTALPRLLEKLAAIVELRRANGRSIFLEEDEMPAALDLFDVAGYNNILNGPLDPALFDMTIEELPEGVWMNLPPLVIEQGETPQQLGKLLVWFVNPYSENKDLAIAYLEHAARPENNLVMYYGAHPNAGDPVESPGYAAKKAEKDAAVADLTSQLQQQGLDAEKKDSLTAQLENVRAELKQLELSRWDIHPDALAQYRKLAPQIRFYEDNPYLMLVGENSDGLNQVMPIYQCYADGTLTLDTFLAELEGKMNMIQKEG